jgi:hypothetical protein
MDVDFVDKPGRTIPGLASHPHGQDALTERELACYTDHFGMYHTGTGPTSAEDGNRARAATRMSPRSRASAPSSP